MNTTAADASEHVQRVAHRTTMVSVVVNVLLATAQVGVGVWSHSQALISDGIHSLADLASDFVVLFANRHSAVDADEDHPYGHRRFENAASLVLAVLLIIVGVGMLWSAGQKIQHIDEVPPVHMTALGVAIFALVSKEWLFRYMLGAAESVRSSMLVANAWHARSDAASSLVVAIGIGGNLAGFRFLDPLAAAIVGFMVLKMGWSFGYRALADLIDTSLPKAEVAAIRATLSDTPGVRGIHLLRTRRMGDLPVVDAHLLVDSTISVSEGHYIAELARQRVLTAHQALDVLIHIDPEDDTDATPPETLPNRNEVLAVLTAACPAGLILSPTTTLHYLAGRIEVDLVLVDAGSDPQVALSALRATLAARPEFGPIRVTRLVDGGAPLA